MAVVLDQRNYIIGDDDNADPDLCTWDAENTPRIEQIKEANFMLRIQVANDGDAKVDPAIWTFLYNTVNDPDTATQITTVSATIAISNGTPANLASMDENVCTEQPESWINGIYIDTSDSVDKTMGSNKYFELQCCVQFDDTAEDGQDYYFFMFYNGAKLNGTYDNVAKVTTETGDLNINVHDCSETTEII